MTDDEEFAQGFILRGRSFGHDDEIITQLALIALAFGAMSQAQFEAIDRLLNEVSA